MRAESLPIQHAAYPSPLTNSRQPSNIHPIFLVLRARAAAMLPAARGPTAHCAQSTTTKEPGSLAFMMRSLSVHAFCSSRISSTLYQLVWPLNLKPTVNPAQVTVELHCAAFWYRWHAIKCWAGFVVGVSQSKLGVDLRGMAVCGRVDQAGKLGCWLPQMQRRPLARAAAQALPPASSSAATHRSFASW